MSVRLLGTVLEQSLAKGAARLVLIALAWHANDYGECYPGVGLIAREAGVSERTAQMALDALTGVGKAALDPPEIERVLHGAPVSRPRQYRPNLYRILIPSGAVRCTTNSGLVVKKGAASGAKERAPVVRTVAPKPSRGTIKEPSSRGPVGINSADDDGRFKEVLDLETARRAASRASAKGEPIRNRVAYANKIRATLAEEDGATIQAALAMHPSLTPAEFVDRQVWHVPAEPSPPPWCGRCEGTGFDPEDFDEANKRTLPCRNCAGSRYAPSVGTIDAVDVPAEPFLPREDPNLSVVPRRQDQLDQVRYVRRVLDALPEKRQGQS